VPACAAAVWRAARRQGEVWPGARRRRNVGGRRSPPRPLATAAHRHGEGGWAMCRGNVVCLRAPR